MYNKAAIVVLAAFASTALARFNINNWCNQDVFVRLSHNGSCDTGPSGNCGDSYRIGAHSIMGFDWIADGAGTSVKIGKNWDLGGGILQFEYAMSDGLYWDLSDLDGRGNGLVGSPFGYDNVKLSPTGNGSGQGTCQKIRCFAGQVCVDSYQHPDDVNTRWCPRDTGDMWLDLCQPGNEFNSKRSHVRAFNA